MNQRRRLLIIAPSWHGNDGIALVTRESVAALCSQFQTTLWGYHDSSPPHPSFNGAWRSYASSRPSLISAALELGLTSQSLLDILVLHSDLAPLALPAKMRGARLTLFLHGVECWRCLRGTKALALRATDRLIANSAHTATNFVRWNWPNRVGKPPPIVCHLGVPPLTGSLEEALASPPLPEQQGPYALIVGRIAASEGYKGHDRLIEAWNQVVAATPSACLLIVGDGDDRLRLEAKVKRFGLSRSISFLGRVPNDQLLGLYAHCEFFVMPSDGEGFGLVYLEAMRAGKPCVAFPGAAEEVIVREETGLIVGDVAELSSAITRLFQFPDETLAMGKAARDRYLSVFTAKAFHRRLLDTMMET